MGFLKKLVPWMASAIPGGGPLAQVALNAVNKVFGSDAKDAESAAKVIAGATPEQLLALRVEEDQFKLKMQEMGFKSETDLATIAAADRDSARKREIAVRDWTPKVLGLSVIALTFALEGYLIVHGIPGLSAEQSMVLGRIMGNMDGGSALVLAYFFGSSAGSDKKNALIEKLTT